MSYAYDALNQLIGRTLDAAGNPATTGDIHETVWVYDRSQVVLQFDKVAAGNLAAGDLAHRYLWGPAVDQLLADEQVDWSDSDADGPVYWAMTDNVGSVRDVVDSDGELRIHRQFDAFGNIVGETHYNSSGSPVTSGQAGYVDEAFAFTSRYFDNLTGLQNNQNRWYDPAVGRWLSEDPIGFEAGDANLYRYVGNEPTRFVDPSGLFWGEVWGGVKGLGQGVCNIANGVQDIAIGAANFPGAAINGIAWTEEQVGILDPKDRLRVGYIPSPDWSRDLITHEGGSGWGDTHNISKFAGGTGVTAGLSACRAGQLARAREAEEAARRAAEEFFRNPLRQPSYTPPYNPRMPRITPPEPPTDFIPPDPRLRPGPGPPFSNN